MAKYAANTSVPTDRSRMEIERTLDRFGADSFLYAAKPDRAVIGFTFKDRQIRFILPMPDRNEFTHTDTGRKRVANAVDEVWEQAKRQRWRSFALVIKAKLAAVEDGIVSFDDEFLAHIVLPNNLTISQELRPHLDEAVRNGLTAPDMLPALTSGHDD